jgi:hypothetical protein
MLTANQWEDGNIIYYNSETWYSFPVTSGTKYYIWLNELNQSNRAKTFNGYVSVFFINV